MEKINPIQEQNTNCLALTVREDYKIVAIKNVVKNGVNLSWKVITSTIILNILNLFI